MLTGALSKGWGGRSSVGEEPLFFGKGGLFEARAEKGNDNAVLTRSPFFYYVFYTSVFPGFVYFRRIQTLDSTLYILHSVFYTSWAMSFLLVAKIV